MTNGTRSVPTRRRAILVIAPASAVFLAAVAYLAYTRRPDAGADRAGAASEAAWVRTSEGDFETQAADVSGPRILLRAATRNTDPGSVKFMGVRRRQEIRLAPGTRITVDLDWNRQANGSGLTAGLVLAPEATTGNPLKLPSAFWVEFVGVPPGRKARRVIGVRADSSSRQLDTEGWPDTNREGRDIGIQRLEIEVGEGGVIKVIENGLPVYTSERDVLAFDRAYLYLQLSSRSNYPPREIYFANVAVRGGR